MLTDTSSQLLDKANILGEQTFLVVFDFDHTILDCNSDVNIPEFLGRKDLQRELVDRKLQWTRLISALLAPFGRAEISEAARTSIVVHPGIIALMQFLMDVQEPCRAANMQEVSPFLEVCIASDANHLFIEEIFAEHFPFLRVTSVHTNAYHNMDGVEPVETCHETGEVRRSKLSWYEPEPGHNCRLCCYRGRPHMCKSRIIHRCLESSKLMDPSVIFVGDGGNDYCPVINCLRPRDFVFARADFPLAKDLALRLGGCCHVETWRDGNQLLRVFKKVVLGAQYRLPTLVRFGDASSNEFRHFTLLRRLPEMILEIVKRNRSTLSTDALSALETLADSVGRPESAVHGIAGHLAQWVQNCACVHLHPSVAGQASISTPCWGQLPWLHGEIFLHAVVLHAAHAAVQACGEGPLLVSPYNYISPLVRHPEHADHTARQRDVGSNVAGTPVSHVNKEPGDIDHPAHSCPPASHEHQYFDGSFLATNTFPCVASPIDYFHSEKSAALTTFFDSAIASLVEKKLWRRDAGDDQSRENLLEILVAMLWGNAFDLSFKKVAHISEPHTTAAARRDNILANDLEALCDYVCGLTATSKNSMNIDVVLDNAGVELVSDLVFAAWVVEHSDTIAVTLHGKPVPFYVSDTTERDLEDVLGALEAESASPTMVAFGTLLRYHFNDTKRLRFACDPCWVAPIEFRELPPAVVNTFFFTQRLVPASATDDFFGSRDGGGAAAVVERVAKSALVVFKGDLNFRRLIGDRHWDHRSFFSATAEPPSESDAWRVDALKRHSRHARGSLMLRDAIADFWPCDVVPVAALRTMKSELSCGVPLEIVDAMDASGKRSTWRVSGEYAVALFSGAPSKALKF